MASAQHGNKSDLPMVFIERYEKLNEAFRQLNSAAVIELLTDDFMFIMKDIPLARGRAAFENILREMFTIVYPHESVNILTVEVNDSSVFETSQVMLRFHFDKNSPIIISGNHFVVWQMQDNDWKIHRYVFQPLLPLE